MTSPASVGNTGLQCAVPHPVVGEVVLGHGSGGKLSAKLFREHLLPHFSNDILEQQGDAAVMALAVGPWAMSTDTFVVQPIEFPGGNIGDLAVHGTVNDLAMMGADPRWLTCALVLEEGLSLALLDRVIASMATAAAACGVRIVAGDTKVVERGKGDGIFINTTGIGPLQPGFAPAPHRATLGDRIIVSGPIGRHGMAVMAARDDLGFTTTIASDTAALTPLVRALRDACGEDVHVLRDPTRGGVASSCNEIAQASGVGMLLDEQAIPVPGNVVAACEVLGLDPLYVANEGVLLAFVAPAALEAALAALRAHPLGVEAAVIGTVVADHPGMVAMRTRMGGTRVVDLLPGGQLPRIC